MSFDAYLARMEAQLGAWKTTLKRDQAEAFDDVAALIVLFRESRTAGKERAGAIKAGLESAWREFSRTAEPFRK